MWYTLFGNMQREEACSMKIMAVDLGDARTGIAVCDRSEFLASPLTVIWEKNRDRLLDKIEQEVLREKPEQVIAVTDYGPAVVAAVQQGLVFGCQFHPEKSGEVGLKILDNFARLNR